MRPSFLSIIAIIAMLAIPAEGAGLGQERIRFPGGGVAQPGTCARGESECQCQRLAQPRVALRWTKHDFHGQGKRHFQHCRDLVLEPPGGDDHKWRLSGARTHREPTNRPGNRN